MSKSKFSIPKFLRNPHTYTIVLTAAMVIIGQLFPMTKYVYVWGDGKDAKKIEFLSNAVQIYAFIGFIVSVVLPALLKMPIVRGILTRFGLLAQKAEEKK